MGSRRGEGRGSGQIFLLHILIEDLLKRGEITFLTKVCLQNFEISVCEVAQSGTKDQIFSSNFSKKKSF